MSQAAVARTAVTPTARRHAAGAGIELALLAAAAQGSVARRGAVGRRPHAQVLRPKPARAQQLGDVGIAGAHLLGQGAGQLVDQGLAGQRVVGDGLHRVEQGLANDFRPQRVALANLDAGDVGLDLAQLPFAVVADGQADAVGRDQVVDLVVIHQREFAPGLLGRGCGDRFGVGLFRGDLLAQALHETL
ncbi:MAG: hypothetical protein JF617_07930 [Burkholderiales bacterium]|nr:hypothetical protein [Burkholderiales bacterium]